MKKPEDSSNLNATIRLGALATLLGLAGFVSRPGVNGGSQSPVAPDQAPAPLITQVMQALNEAETAPAPVAAATQAPIHEAIKEDAKPSFMHKMRAAGVKLSHHHHTHDNGLDKTIARDGAIVERDAPAIAREGLTVVRDAREALGISSTTNMLGDLQGSFEKPGQGRG